MKDTYKAKGLRKRLAQEVARKGIHDDRILRAIENVPRHFFLDTAFIERAYEDTAFPIAEGQTISQPFTVAYQTQLLKARPGDKVLEIGTGSGYQAAILCEMGVELYSIERIKELHQQAKHILKAMGYVPKLFLKDGTEGLPENAPYDGILVTAAAPSIPQTLKEQLKINGKLIIPVGDKNLQQMVRITRTGQDNFETEEFDQFRFVPLIGRQGW